MAPHILCHGKPCKKHPSAFKTGIKNVIRFRGALLAIFFLFAITAGHARAEVSQKPSCSLRHPMNDAWWTGPMLANTAATAPRGHSLIEPYLYDVTTQGTFDANGARHKTPHANGYGSLTYLIYGLTDKIGVGLIPTFGYNTATGSPSSSRPGMGDLTLQLQRRLTQFQPCRWVPIISAAVQETLPTGKYDRLGNRLMNGIGTGAYTTNFEALSQMYFWLPNRRILRMRLDVTDAFSSSVNVRDASVYGTADGFRGTAKPGRSFFIDNSWEYSLTRSWVVALDATYRNNADTRVAGNYHQSSGSSQSLPAVRIDSGTSDAYGLAPAIEYSWKPSVGVLLGVRLIPAGRNTDATITPAIAINIIH
jgi:hypothetical protein